MEIKDVLHFYVGQWVTVTSLSGSAIGAGFELGRYVLNFEMVHYILSDRMGIRNSLELRRLSDMTEKDGLAIFGSETKYLLYRKEARELGADLWLFTANEYTRLLKAGFDCHDLIPNGLAIDNKSI